METVIRENETVGNIAFWLGRCDGDDTRDDVECYHMAEALYAQMMGWDAEN